MILFYASLLNTVLASEPFKLFPKVDHWEIGEIDHYNTNTLYNAINGGSELYLKYNFEGMTTADYLHNDNYITVELYKHASPIDAFGVYSMERPQEDKYLDIGVQGFGESDYTYFVAGQYYIKVRALKVSDESKDAMQAIISKLDMNLNGKAVFPMEFNYFPAKDKIRFSERYINESVMAYSFLRHSYEVKYSNGEKEYTLFMLKSDTEDGAGRMLQAYLEASKMIKDVAKNQFISINDRYNGDIGLMQVGNYLLCSRGDLTQEVSEQLLNEIANNIQRY